MLVVFFALAGFVFNFFLKKNENKVFKKVPPIQHLGLRLGTKIGVPP